MNLTKTTPMAHQVRAVERSKDARYFGLFMEQGTGKTFCTIATATHLFDQGLIDTVIVLAPNGVHDNWAINELPTHLRDDLRPITQKAVWHSSDGLRAKNQFNYALRNHEDGQFLWIMANIEALRVKAFNEALHSGKFSFKRTLLVVDESTTIKNPKAQTTKAAIALADACGYKRILSGTPMSQGPLDLWSQCRFLSPDALPYKSWTAYKHEFAIEEVINLGPHRPSFVKVVGYRNQSLLSQLIARFSERVLKKDCLDLPEKIRQTRYVELTPEQKRIYYDLSQKAIASLEPGVLSVTSSLALILRLQQVVLGYAPNEAGELIPIPSERLSALYDILDQVEPETKGIIFCRFREDVKRVMEVLDARNERGVQYHGGIGTEDRTDAVEQFQNDPKVRWFVATDAAARGLTLTAATLVVYYSQGYSLETRLQSEDRAHRIGQKKSVVYVDLMARGTVDEKIVQALQHKKDLADEIIDRKALERLLALSE